MSARQVLRASTILRSTPKFRGWEAKWKKQVTGSMPWRCHTWALSLCFSLLPIYEEVSSLCHMILQPRPRMMDWNLRHCELKQDPPTPQLFLPILSRRRQAHAHSHLSLLSQWRWHRWNVSIGWQRYEIREQDGGGGALTATPLPPSFSTSIYVSHGFKSDSTVLIMMLNIFLLDFFQEMLRFISALGGNGYRWCPWPMGHGDHLVVLLPIVSKYERRLRLESGSSLPPLTLPFPSVHSWEITAAHFPFVYSL